MKPEPSIREKLLFWILLGLLSTYFAESVAGSTLFPFTTLIGLFFVFPVYFLHIVVLATILCWRGVPRFCTLYAGGMLFGMYESYMTKVLWISNSPQGPLVRLAGISVLDFLALVLFWHPLMAFVLPLVVGDRWLTRSPSIRFCRFRGDTRSWLAVAALCGFNQGIHSPSPLYSLASGAICFLLLTGFGVYWRRLQGDEHDLRNLLPNTRQFGALAILLAGQYLFFTFRFRAEKLPGWGPQLAVLVVYALLGILLVLHLRKSQFARRVPPVARPISSPLFAQMLIVTTGASSVCSLVFMLSGLREVTYLSEFVVSCLAGLVLLAGCIAALFQEAQIVGTVSGAVPSI